MGWAAKDELGGREAPIRNVTSDEGYKLYKVGKQNIVETILNCGTKCELYPVTTFGTRLDTLFIFYGFSIFASQPPPPH